jgi:3-deoxy-D-manno-octulosonic-acid transferase
MRWIADAAYLLAGFLYLPVALYHALILGKNRRGWGQRLGAVPRLDSRRPRIWVHAVSLGEINATPRLVAALRRRLNVDIVFSTTTDTGFARAVQLYGEDKVFRFPLDFSGVVSRALRRINPSMIVLVELEVWYNLTRLAAKRGIPVVVVNGRMTAHSARRFAWLGRLARPMFRELTWVGAQDDTIAGRFRAAGVPPERVEVTSSLKWDTAAVADHIDGADALARAIGIDRSRPVWVCGSTGDGEETLVLDAYRDLLASSQNPTRERGALEAANRPSSPSAGSHLPVLAIVPRKPERFDEVARLVESRGFVCVRRSAHPDGGPVPQDRNAVILGDTMGELRKFYSLADVVFVGRSLVPLGGSDPMEVAALGKPIIVGPHMENFDAPTSALTAANATQTVASPDDLAQAVRTLLSSPESTRAMGLRAREVVVRQQGATDRTADRLAELVPENRRH